MSFVTLLLLLVLGPVVASARAAGPAQLWQAPEDGIPGSGAGQLNRPAGIATDPSTGDVYVVDEGNNRISVFSPWGEFLEAFGWGVADGEPEPESCGPDATPPTSECRGGIAGDGPGQLNTPAGGIAVDSAGNVYVGEFWENHRVQKFSTDGSFEFMLGAGVEKGPLHPGDICTAEDLTEGDDCGAGVVGSSGGQFETVRRSDSTYVAVGPDDRLYVGDIGRVQIFASDGAFERQVSLPASLASEYVASLAVDSSSSILLTTAGPCSECGTKPVVLKVSPTGAIEQTYAMERGQDHPGGIAVDGSDNLYVIVNVRGYADREIIEFNSSGVPLIPQGAGFAKRTGDVSKGGIAYGGLATNSVDTTGGIDLYVSESGAVAGQARVSAFGPQPTKWPKPARPPTVTEQYVLGAGSSYAELGARINPRFWQDTTYYVEYGLGRCASGGCDLHSPAPPGAGLGAGAVDVAAATAPVTLVGLRPGTTYHYRFVAQSGGGGPTTGVGPVEAEGIFDTPRKATEANDCPNSTFRLGAGAALSDCRAYELVSPLDKDGGDVLSLIEAASGLPGVLNQSAVDGGAFAFGSYRAYDNADSAPFTSQYLAARGTDGWTSRGITPPRERIVAQTAKGLDTELKALSPDLCQGWLLTLAEPRLAPGAVPGYSNLYRHEQPGPGCSGSSAYEALTTIKPHLPPSQAETYVLELQGVSADGTTAIFLSSDNLRGTGAPAVVGGTQRELYQKTGDETRYVCILPAGIPSNDGCSAGSPGLGVASGNPRNRDSNLDHAISADGSRIFWTATAHGIAPLYVRIDGSRTVPVSETAEGLSGTTGSKFWTASADGERVIFSTGNTTREAADLYEFDVDAETTTRIAGDAGGVLGAGEDARWIYFESSEALGGANGEGREPVAGIPNLYLDVEGSIRFVASLAKADVGDPNAFSSNFAAITSSPYGRLARVSPDGHVAAFTSFADPTGYDSTDVVTGKHDAEVYLYDATADRGTGKLICASCNPSGARPHGENILAHFNKGAEFWAGGYIPGWQSSLYASRALSADGQRLFFLSSDALALQDTNGVQDVYEWEALGAGGCRKASPTFSAAAAGCIDLVSSGKSAERSEFLDADETGNNVFFNTGASLVPEDYGLIDIYDARVDGGFPSPPPPPAPCEGEACQNPPPPPGQATPASSAYHGPGNLSPTRARRCPRGRRAARKKGKATRKSGKVRCVKKHRRLRRRHRQHHRRHHGNGGRGRQNRGARR